MAHDLNKHHVVWILVDLYVTTANDRLALAMTCKAFKEIYYEKFSVLRFQVESSWVLHFLCPLQQTVFCRHFYETNPLTSPNYIQFLVRLMDVCDPSVGSLVCNDLASKGRWIRLERVFEYALCPEAWCSNICEAAASTGQIEVIKWLTRSGHAKLTSAVCEHAATNGQLRVIKYVLSKDPSLWVERIAFNAASGNHLSILEWCIANGYSFCIRRAIDEATSCGKQYTVEGLQRIFNVA